MKHLAQLTLVFVAVISLGNAALASGNGYEASAPVSLAPAHAHLQFQNGALHAHASWVSGPVVSDESILRLEWKSGATHQPVEPNGSVKVILWMPDMGHGSSPTQIQQTLDQTGQPVTGSYDVRSMYFVMGGTWQVKVQLTTADGQKETQLFTVDLGGEGGHHH